MKCFLLLLAAACLFGCSSKRDKEADKAVISSDQAEIDSLLITENSWGGILKGTDIEGLKKIFGESEIEDSTIMGPEGIDTLQVTYIHAGTGKELIIHWRDSLHHRAIGFIEAYQPNSPYKTDRGLKIGSTLRDLLRVNQKPINFTGFGWDYGGYIMSYNQGTLDSSRINFRMEGKESLPQGLYGDAEINTEMQLVKDNLDKIHIYSIMLNFYEH